MRPSQNMVPTVTPATSYSSCSTWRGATRLRMTSLTAVSTRPLTCTSTVSSSTTRWSPASIASRPGGPVVARQRREEADVAVVDAERRDAAAEQAAERAQDGAVAAEHEADVGGAESRLVDDRVAERAIGAVVPGGLVGGHQQLERRERSRERGQLRQRGASWPRP